MGVIFFLVGVQPPQPPANFYPDQNVKFLHHLSGTYYVNVNSGYRCVDLRKWFQPFDAAGDIKPTKSGVSLRLNEWSNLCGLVDVINKTYPSLGSAQPCYYDDDHMNQLGWLNCTVPPLPGPPQSTASEHYSLDRYFVLL